MGRVAKVCLVIAALVAAATTGCSGNHKKSIRSECLTLRPKQSTVWTFLDDFGRPDRITDYSTAAGVRQSGGVWHWGKVTLGVDAYGTVFFANCH
jgi:hypothetical protein